MAGEETGKAEEIGSNIKKTLMAEMSDHLCVIFVKSVTHSFSCFV